MTSKERLLSSARDFCSGKDIGLSRLSTIVVNDGGFFSRLESGGSCTMATFEKFERIFADPDAWEEAKTAAAARERASRQERMAS